MDRNAYAAALCREIRMAAEALPETEVDTVFIGGGTPTTLSPGELSMIMREVREAFSVFPDAEITMEMNPGTYSEGMLAFVKEHLTRVSIGLQSACDEELKVLGRIHTYDEFESCYRALRGAGVHNINVDLMSALPGQTVQSWEYTLRKVICLDPEHISAYSLIIEEETPFYDLYESGEIVLPDEDEEREMYHLTKSILAGAGYERYEISNYAKPGYVCRHNIRYWKREPYLGFGVGAASMYGELIPNSKNNAGEDSLSWKPGDGLSAFDGFCNSFSGQYRRTNGTDIRSYVNHYRLNANGESKVGDGENTTTPLRRKDVLAEYMFLGLRMTEGISEREFTDVFGFPIEAVYGKIIRKYTANGLLERRDGRIALTERGLDVSNVVMGEFLL